MDITTLWNHANPEESEKRFLAALENASGDDVIILKTQIARTYGIRQDFLKAQEILSKINIDKASVEAQVYYALELGRTFASATHTNPTPEDKEKARQYFMQAFELAKNADAKDNIDDLAVDALHMMAFVDTEPETQLAWDLKALAYMEKSGQEKAKRWAGSLYNNVGYALHLAGRFEEALENFRASLASHEQTGKTQNIRVAHWMIAHTLRFMGRNQEALKIQLRLEQECLTAGTPDPYVFEELEALYKILDNQDKAAHYAKKILETQARNQ